MIPTLKNVLKLFPHTYWLSPPSLLRFCTRDTHKCFPERVTIFLKKPRKSERETLSLVLFKFFNNNFKNFNRYRSAERGNMERFCHHILQRTKYWILFTNVLPKC